MKNVLFVSDNFIGGGLETRIAEQVAVYKQSGVKCFLVCQNYNKNLTEIFDECFQLELATRDFGTIIKTAKEIESICVTKRIDMIDCHPLFGFVPAVLAAQNLNIPIVYTLHGLYSLPEGEDAYVPVFNFLLEHAVTKIVFVAGYLAEKYPILTKNTDTLIAPNGVAGCDKATVVGQFQPGYFAFASRLSHEKTALLINAIPTLIKAEVRELDVYGDGEAIEELKSAARDYAEDMKINIMGWQDDMRAALVAHEYEAMIGMGRVLIEALSVNLPVILLGYGGLLGAVAGPQFKNCMDNNFTSWESRPEAKVLKSFKDLRAERSAYQLQSLVCEQLDAEKLWQNYLREMERLKARHYEAMEIINIFCAEIGRCEEKTRVLEKQKAEILNSTSWKLLKPVRGVKKLLRAR